MHFINFTVFCNCVKIVRFCTGLYGVYVFEYHHMILFFSTLKPHKYCRSPTFIRRSLISSCHIP